MQIYIYFSNYTNIKIQKKWRQAIAHLHYMSNYSITITLHNSLHYCMRYPLPYGQESPDR